MGAASPELPVPPQGPKVKGRTLLQAAPRNLRGSASGKGSDTAVQGPALGPANQEHSSCPIGFGAPRTPHRSPGDGHPRAAPPPGTYRPWQDVGPSKASPGVPGPRRPAAPWTPSAQPTREELAPSRPESDWKPSVGLETVWGGSGAPYGVLLGRPHPTGQSWTQGPPRPPPALWGRTGLRSGSQRGKPEMEAPESRRQFYRRVHALQVSLTPNFSA